jgi:hypothetical protein
MTLYRPVHKNGTPGLPSEFMTMAILWVLLRDNWRDWRIEQIAVAKAGAS